MNRPQSELERTMALLAAEHRAASAPASVERAVLAAFDGSHRKHFWGIAAAAAIAATIGVGATLLRERPAPPRPAVVAPTVVSTAVESKPAPKPRPRKRAVVAARTDRVEAPFITIPYTVPIGPEENATVVRMTLSPSAMAVAGFPLLSIDPAGTQADVLVGEDGRARAIRIVANR